MSTPLSNRNGNGNGHASVPDMGALAGLAGLVLSGAQANGLDASYQSLKKAVREGITRDPLDALVVTVAGGAFLFWLAERDENPKCTTYLEALVYVSTCLSVGYADIFARTPAGRAIATAIMTVGPAMAAKALDPPKEATPEDDATLAVQKVIADKLDAILTELRKK